MDDTVNGLAKESEDAARAPESEAHDVLDRLHEQYGKSFPDSQERAREGQTANMADREDDLCV